MIDENGSPFTAHTTNLVPFILIKDDVRLLQKEGGKLSNIAPTILHIMGINKPAEMDEKSLIRTSISTQ